MVVPRSGDGSLSADELHTPSLTNFLYLAQQDASNLSRHAYVRAAAGRQIEIVNVNQTQLVFLYRRYLAQPEIARLCQRDETDIHLPVFQDYFIRQVLGGDHMLLRQRRGFQIDRAI